MDCVPRLIEWSLLHSGGFIMITEFVEGQDLFNTLLQKGCFSFEDARQIFIQAVHIANQLFTLKIHHSDVKLENFMLVRFITV